MRRILEIKSISSRNDNLIIAGTDTEQGEWEIVLNPIEVAQLVGALRANVEEVTGSAVAPGGWGLPGMTRVQYVESPETLYFRIFVGDHVYHEYPVPANTTLARHLRGFADRLEAESQARATHQAPDTKN